MQKLANLAVHIKTNNSQTYAIHFREEINLYTVSEKDCTLFYFFFLGAQCVESGVSCTDCY